MNQEILEILKILEILREYLEVKPVNCILVSHHKFARDIPFASVHILMMLKGHRSMVCLHRQIFGSTAVRP